MELPDPAYMSYGSTPEELVKADRNTLGNTIKERITIKAVIEVEWKGINADEKNAIVTSTAANTFSMRYLDVFDDTIKYANFYRQASPKIVGYGKFNGTKFQLYDVTMAFTEI